MTISAVATYKIIIQNESLNKYEKKSLLKF